MRIYQNPAGFSVVVLHDGGDAFQERIHAWGEHLPDTGDIHQHRADFTSTVLEGFINEEIWAYRDDPAGEWERLTVNCAGDDGQGGYRVEVFDRTPCSVKIREVLTHRAGTTYKRDAADLHRVFPVQLPVVTRVTAGPVRNRVHTIVRKRAIQPDG